MTTIELKNLSLSYPIYGTNAMSFKTTLVNIATGGRLNKETGSVSVEALKDVSFRLEKGDRLALIGHNGAGKSTLLRVLAQVYEPTQGHIHIKGRTNSLFDLMLGVDPELNGYENILLRGRIAGLSKKEAQKIISSVEEFADLGDFMKMPIKTYSSGMQVRLGFGIMTSIFSEILLIDEIINVGDAQFIKKAKERIKNLVHQADILVLSTHDTNTVREFCNKALWLEHGVVKCIGNVEDVLNMYNSKYNAPL